MIRDNFSRIPTLPTDFRLGQRSDFYLDRPPDSCLPLHHDFPLTVTFSEGRSPHGFDTHTAGSSRLLGAFWSTILPASPPYIVEFTPTLRVRTTIVKDFPSLAKLLSERVRAGGYLPKASFTVCARFRCGCVQLEAFAPGDKEVISAVPHSVYYGWALYSYADLVFCMDLYRASDVEIETTRGWNGLFL